MQTAHIYNNIQYIQLKTYSNVFYTLINNEPLREKQTIWVSDQVRRKPACIVKVEGKKLEISGIAKTKALISFVVTAKLVCAFVFAYAICSFSHAVAQNIGYTVSIYMLK